LADIALLEELLLALEVLGGHVQRSASGHHLGVAGGSVLVGSPGVDACQHLAGLDGVADFDVECNHGASHLRGQNGLAHSLDDTVESCGVSRSGCPDRGGHQCR
jgi:hypothetical protein